MLNKEKLIDWCWLNLEFTNGPENWEDTYIIDIINGYDGRCHTKDRKSISYYEIRKMFKEDDE